MKIKVMLADDHALIRDGIKTMIQSKAKDIGVIGEATNGQELLEIAKLKKADVYIVDISMPVLNGIEATINLKKSDPDCKVIILSMHEERTFVEKAMRSGACGYIIKESATEDIIRAIREVHTGSHFLSPKISGYMVEGFLSKSSDPRGFKNSKRTLTKREKEILQLLAEALSNREIAEKLSLSYNTIHVHRNNIMRKLGVNRQADLIRFALKEGLTQL